LNHELQPVGSVWKNEELVLWIAMGRRKAFDLDETLGVPWITDRLWAPVIEKILLIMWIETELLRVKLARRKTILKDVQGRSHSAPFVDLFVE
jgi:hypothetical protein